MKFHDTSGIWIRQAAKAACACEAPVGDDDHWHCLALRDGAAGFEESDALSDVFIDAFVAAGEPVDMAVFRRRGRGNGYSIHWFSPAAHAVAMQWHAAECDRPASGDGLLLMLGDEDAWRVLFPAAVLASSQRDSTSAPHERLARQSAMGQARRLAAGPVPATC